MLRTHIKHKFGGELSVAERKLWIWTGSYVWEDWIRIEQTYGKLEVDHLIQNKGKSFNIGFLTCSEEKMMVFLVKSDMMMGESENEGWKNVLCLRQ